MAAPGVRVGDAGVRQWLVTLDCGHQLDLSGGMDRDVLACEWPPCCGELRQVISAVQVHPGDEDRLMRGEPVPGLRGACTRDGCAHGAMHHRNPVSNSRRTCRGQRCYAGGCRCPGWTSEAGAVMPPEPVLVPAGRAPVQEALW